MRITTNIDRDEVKTVKLDYWDYSRDVPMPPVQPEKEYLFVEMDRTPAGSDLAWQRKLTLAKFRSCNPARFALVSAGASCCYTVQLSVFTPCMHQRVLAEFAADADILNPPNSARGISTS